MDNLRKGIKLYFDKWNSETISLNDSNSLFQFSNFESYAKGHKEFENYTNTDINLAHRKITEDWMYCPKLSTKVQSPFYLLNHFTNQILTEREAEPFVVYHHLLKWRNVTMDLGEDIFTTSYLAHRDLQSRKERVDFAWRPILFSDNYRLHQILQQGVAENHSHLWASSLTFDISWMALMNNYNKIKSGFLKFLKEASLAGHASFDFSTKRVDFEVLVKKAITIRLLLQLFIDGRWEEQATIEKENENRKVLDTDISYIDSLLQGNIDSLFTASNKEDSIEFLCHFDEIVQHIELLGIEKGLKVKHATDHKYFDYAALDQMHSDNIDKCFYLFGERHLMYQTFKAIYKAYECNKRNVVLETLLHKYLLIKSQFRRELILLNERVGFENFKNYQDRKFYFIPNNSIYAAIFLRITLNYNRRLMKIKSNEFRIGPESSYIGWKKNLNSIIEQRLKKTEERFSIKGYDGNILLNRLKFDKKNKIKQNRELHFVIHFFKRADALLCKQNEQYIEKNRDQQLIKSRDFELRKEVQKSASKIVELRERDPQLAKRITGVDAASSELVSRAEAFGQAFRYLKYHQSRVKNTLFKDNVYNNQLRITFHAGEDFYDIVDGMRYIDECIRYLNMGQGDRFGHALAIGLDVLQFYSSKKNKIMLSKHTLLDNIAWLLSKVRKFGLGIHNNEVARLENKFANLFSEVYLNSNCDIRLDRVDHRVYYEAWKLRGDDPKIYKNVMDKASKSIAINVSVTSLEGYFASEINLTYWDSCGLNIHAPNLKSIRNRYETSRLYYEYHYNPEVKNKGNEVKQFEITSGYIKLVQDVQIAMMRYVSERNLCIETNPTSNFLIGPIDRYIEHPILKWHNLGLHHDSKVLKESPQLSVSINTDDAGVFSTSLENEFALMAIALEKEKDEYGNAIYPTTMIYDWIDRVRKMGIEQSFNRVQ